MTRGEKEGLKFVTYDSFRIGDESNVGNAVDASDVESPDCDIFQVFRVVRGCFDSGVEFGPSVHVVPASVTTDIPRQHSTDFHDFIPTLTLARTKTR